MEPFCTKFAMHRVTDGDFFPYTKALIFRNSHVSRITWLTFFFYKQSTLLFSLATDFALRYSAHCYPVNWLIFWTNMTSRFHFITEVVACQHFSNNTSLANVKPRPFSLWSFQDMKVLVRSGKNDCTRISKFSLRDLLPVPVLLMAAYNLMPGAYDCQLLAEVAVFSISLGLVPLIRDFTLRKFLANVARISFKVPHVLNRQNLRESIVISHLEGVHIKQIQGTETSQLDIRSLHVTVYI